MVTILAQSIASPAIPSTFLSIIAIVVFGYLAYKSLIKKEDKFQLMLAGIPAVLITLALMVFAMLPTAIFAIFGPLTGLFTMVGEIMVSVLAGMFFASMLNVIAKVWKAEVSIPGF